MVLARSGEPSSSNGAEPFEDDCRCVDTSTPFTRCRGCGESPADVKKPGTSPKWKRSSDLRPMGSIPPMKAVWRHCRA